MPSSGYPPSPGSLRTDFFVKGDDFSQSVDFRFLDSALSPRVEAVCLYEYMRESQTLRDALNAGREDQGKQKAFGLSTPFFVSFPEPRFVALIFALQKAGFPKPWQRLSKVFQRRLVVLLAESMEGMMRGDKALYPPVVIEQASPEFDYLENHWGLGQLEPSELSLLKGWDRSGR